MVRDRLIYGIIAAVVGVVVGVGGVFLGGVLASETKPATDVNSFNSQDGFVQGSVEYGSRGGSVQTPDIRLLTSRQVLADQ
ncbi:DUF2613 family protein [Gordonia sp. HY442]|uniref:DUF2613 family protein n=1 Tax=Gordonia zhenghanii TaxID=2911516 RepID=UPI001F204406|nr:DUF2613 family protein [Gordonia zhenghanii]MCF8603533.1 DUF2613 family protein [Gordonia zhenghanii]